MRHPLPSAWQDLGKAQKQSSHAARQMRLRVRRKAVKAQPIDSITSARVAGLRYVNEASDGIRRVGAKGRFRYVLAGRTIRNAAELQRIRALAIPPAWTDVWICTNPRGHLQATGRDARGRKQYRYHPNWRTVRDEVKYSRLIAFADALPAVRRRTDADLKRSGLSREKVLAAVVQLLERTLIRIGNAEYARHNHSIGLTTMRDEHAKVRGGAVRFEFRGKSGIEHAVDLHDRRLARIVRACRDLPGQKLFQYLDQNARRQSIGSADVNAYLRAITGRDFTAKDFRTWAGTVLAARALCACEEPASKTHAKREIVKAIASVATSLGNTKAVCRKSYIHPAVLDAYTDGVTIRRYRRPAGRTIRSGHLDAEEAAVVALLVSRLRQRAA